LSAKPSNSKSTTLSGRNVVITRPPGPPQPSAASLAWRLRSSSGDSVVASTSIPNRSNSARGRNAGSANRAASASYTSSAVSGRSEVSRSKTSANVCSSHSRDGVPRNRCQCATNNRQIRRPSVSTGSPLRVGTPSSAGRTPWLSSIRVT
jgi:hypothetical protein